MLECTRCHKLVDQTFVIKKGPSLSFADVDLTKPPVYEAPCGDCLTDKEIADKLAPVLLFGLYAMLAPAPSGSEIQKSLEHVRAWIQMQLKAVNAIQTAQMVTNLQTKNAELRQQSLTWRALAEGAQNDLLLAFERRCAKCNYRKSGDENAVCPVDGSKMVPVTWRESALTASRIASRARKRCEILEAAWPDGHAIPIGEEAEDKSIEEKIEFLQEKGLYDIAFRNAGVGLIFFNPPEGYGSPEQHMFGTREVAINDGDEGGGTMLDVPTIDNSWRTYLVVEAYYPSFDEAVDGEWRKRQ
jgi:RNA polymerase subunit RPABC4/transcription elongation factor Spt4